MLGEAYVFDQLLCLTSGYSVYLGEPPACLMASTMFRLRSTGTVRSEPPWNTQILTLFIFSASAGSQPPRTGIAAANVSGLVAIAPKVPKPPIDCPVTYTRSGSRGYCFLMISSSSKATGRSCFPFSFRRSFGTDHTAALDTAGAITKQGYFSRISALASTVAASVLPPWPCNARTSGYFFCRSTLAGVISQ